MLKSHYDQILDIHFFTFSYTIYRCFLDILPNLDLLRTLQQAFFGTFISENLALPLISLLQFFVENWDKWRHFLKNTARIEIIIITMLVQQFAWRRTNTLAPVFVQFCTIIVITISIGAVFLRIWRHFHQLEQGKLMAAVDSQK